MTEDPQFDTPQMWLEIGKCYLYLNDHQNAETLFRQGLIFFFVMSCKFAFQISIGRSSFRCWNMYAHDWTISKFRKSRRCVELNSRTYLSFRYNIFSTLSLQRVIFSGGKPLDLRIQVQKAFLHYSRDEEDLFLQLTLPILTNSALFPYRRRRKSNKPKILPPEIDDEEGIIEFTSENPSETGSEEEIDLPLSEIISVKQCFALIQKVLIIPFFQKNNLTCYFSNKTIELLCKKKQFTPAAEICTKTLSYLNKFSDIEKDNLKKIKFYALRMKKRFFLPFF